MQLSRPIATPAQLDMRARWGRAVYTMHRDRVRLDTTVLLDPVLSHRFATVVYSYLISLGSNLFLAPAVCLSLWHVCTLQQRIQGRALLTLSTW
jgi:hypothetical protein